MDGGFVFSCGFELIFHGDLYGSIASLKKSILHNINYSTFYKQVYPEDEAIYNTDGALEKL